MSTPPAQMPSVDVRMHGLPEIADTDWISLTGGITVLTGRNNVGKSRILQAVAALAPVAGIPEPTPVPQARIRTRDATIEFALAPGAALARYQVTDAGGSVITAAWEPDPNNPESSRLRINDEVRFSASSDDKPAWYRCGLPMAGEAIRALGGLVYVPPQRTIAGTVQAERLEIPGPFGADLGRAIYTRRNDATAEFDELQAVMADLFPEIDAILTPPTPNGVTVRITYRDRYARRNTALEASGTGVAQALHLVALTLFSEPGRIFLIDEPHAFLHPGAERSVVRFLRAHPEHSYVCATHSPVFISAADPEACYLVTRDEDGTAIRSVFASGLNRRHIFAELGISAGDVALAERVLLVEGPSDRAAYTHLFSKLGYDVNKQNCLVMSLAGADLTRPLSAILTELSDQLQLPFTVLLDGDKRDQYIDNPAVCCLPASDLEEFLLQDPAAVRAGLLAAVAEEDPGRAETAGSAWPEARIRTYLADKRKHQTKAADLLKGLGREMGITYRKAVHTPAIAQHLSQTVLDQLKPIVSRIGTI